MFVLFTAKLLINIIFVTNYTDKMQLL